jgi:chaperone modulatory protein CbpM
MISFAMLRTEMSGLEADDVARWIAADFLRAAGSAGAWEFEEIDAARLRLIVELRAELEVEEPSLPIVLSLMDQVYAYRRRLRAVLAAVPPDLRQTLTHLDP